MDKKTIGIIAAVAVIVVVVAAAAFTMMGGNDEKQVNTYYVFLDGMDDVDGWYTGTGDNPLDGFKNALDSKKVGYDLGKNGWINTIDGNEATYDAATGTGIGYGVYEYLGLSAATADVNNFKTGPVIGEVVGNILYINYSKYSMTETGTAYEITPTTTENASKLKTGGPFADKTYKPLSYGDTYYVYLDGFDSKSGWYTCKGNDLLTALTSTLKSKNISYEIKNGWIVSIDGKESTYDAATGKGVGYEILTYGSTNTTVGDKTMFLLPSCTFDKMVGNISYIAYTGYAMDLLTYDTVYDLTPSSQVVKTGPFKS